MGSQVLRPRNTGAHTGKKKKPPPNLSEITGHCILSVLCPSFSNMFPLGREEERMKWGPKDKNMLRAELICIFALCGGHMDSRINVLCPILIPAFSFPRCLKLCDANF